MTIFLINLQATWVICFSFCNAKLLIFTSIVNTQWFETCAKGVMMCYVPLFKVNTDSSINNRLCNYIQFSIQPRGFHPSTHHLIFWWFWISSMRKFNCSCWFTLTNQWRSLILKPPSITAQIIPLVITSSWILSNSGLVWIPNR